MWKDFRLIDRCKVICHVNAPVACLIWIEKFTKHVFQLHVAFPVKRARVCFFKYVLSAMDLSKESIKKFVIGNRFHLTLRILSLLYLNTNLGCVSFTWSRFPIKILLIISLFTPIVESTYLSIDMCKFESSQKDESRTQSSDSSEAYRKPSAFNWICFFCSQLH